MKWLALSFIAIAVVAIVTRFVAFGRDEPTVIEEKRRAWWS